jgi:hypothetical protein
MEAYAEFDKLVAEYNKWFISLEKRKTRRLKNILIGMGSVLGLGLYRRRYHPIYSRDDLKPGQMDAILLASDIVRVKGSLEAKTKDVPAAQFIADQMYAQYREMFVNYRQ